MVADSYSMVSHDFSCVLIDAYVSKGVEGNVVLQTACNQSTVLAVAVSWRGQESILVVRRLSCIWQVH